MSDNQEREEVYTGDVSDDSIATGQERRTRLYDRFLFLKENYREEAAAEIANWTIKQGVEDYSDKSLGAVCTEFYFPGFGTSYITVFEDNERAKNLAQTPVCTSNSKHIDVRHHVLRELIFEGEFVITHVESDDQHADVLTRMLDYTAFCHHRDF